MSQMHGSQMSHSANRSMMPAEKGGSIKVTGLSEEFTLDDFAAEHGADHVPLGVIADGQLDLHTADHAPTAGPGDVYLALIRAADAG